MDPNQPLTPPPPTSEPPRGFLTWNHKRFLVLALCVGVMIALIRAMLGSIQPEGPSPNADTAIVQPPEAAFHSRFAPLGIPSSAHHSIKQSSVSPVVRSSPTTPLAVTQATPHPTPPPLLEPKSEAQPAPSILPLPRIVALSIQPAQIQPGEMASLCVRSLNARKLFITGSGIARWSLPIACVPLHPMKTATYTVTAIDADGRKTHRSALIHVAATPTEEPSPTHAFASPAREPTPESTSRKQHRHHKHHDASTPPPLFDDATKT